MSFPERVKIVEVGPRDGLQNESVTVPAEIKVQLVEKLADAGLSVIESGAFVSPKWVPQMATSAEVFKQIDKRVGISYPMLVPNLKGLELAHEAGVQEIALFAATTETFSQKNTNCSIAESIDRFNAVIDQAQALDMKIRGYISCVLGCPYEGEVSSDTVLMLAQKLFDKGCYEVSLGDTIGVGTAGQASDLVEKLSRQVPVRHLAAHFHDTYGQALANIHAVMQCGIAVIDSSVAGLGGCPYAKGATGNVATEDVIYMLHGMGIETGVDMDKLLEAGRFISDFLGREPVSRAATALLRKRAG
ncbi:MAG: hydroxymethylglutaryl-CoA lyase [Gammaproteobacteria bacterium]|nr:hydroxymethylglutaryl-CoA lyase [Gammaproteobacteria bacterium]MDH3859879.1 hydroxymethylglutaryl-CoA lyase [Gammaproteobacteria bacterium]